MLFELEIKKVSRLSNTSLVEAAGDGVGDRHSERERKNAKSSWVVAARL